MLASARYRIAQGLSHLRPVPPSAGDLLLAEQILSARQFALFRSMPQQDQRHHCCVAARLTAEGQVDPDLLQAALLHDAGKFDGSRGPNVAERTMVVLLASVAPGLLARLSREDHRWNRGLYLAVHHPALGAQIAGEAGCNVRVQWLIAHHGDERIEDDDLLLRALQSADSAC